jgi:hypothetical protein
MYEGVGNLRIVEIPVQRMIICEGFVSNDKTETVKFSSAISMLLPLDEFTNEFDKQLRLVMTYGCDLITEFRVDTVKKLLNDVLPERVVLVAKEIFMIRLATTKPQESLMVDQCLNQTIVLSNFSIFCEDLWLCLGYCLGTVLFTKAEHQKVIDEYFKTQWRNSLQVMYSVCIDSIVFYQSQLNDTNITLGRRALYSSLMQLEVCNLQTVKDLQSCNCRESALEMWSGRYQLRFLYNREDRIKNIPFEVSMGCVNIPYGMEYYGGLFRLHLGPGII